MVDVSEDSANAKKFWPLWKPPEGQIQNEAAVSHESGSENTDRDAIPREPLYYRMPSAQAQPLATKRPSSRRKPKLQLAELPSAVSRKREEAHDFGEARA